ncbi:MAG TPA: hypothetical protein V6C78_05180 [Crinalium sp.]
MNSIARLCVRDTHAKSGFWGSGALRRSPKSPFVKSTLTLSLAIALPPGRWWDGNIASFA